MTTYRLRIKAAIGLQLFERRADTSLRKIIGENATSTTRTDMAAAAGARCHGDRCQSSPWQQLHGTVSDQRRPVAAARRSAWLREDWIGGDDGRS